VCCVVVVDTDIASVVMTVSASVFVEADVIHHSLISTQFRYVALQSTSTLHLGVFSSDLFREHPVGKSFNAVLLAVRVLMC
jgi:hypothetical protein